MIYRQLRRAKRLFDRGRAFICGRLSPENLWTCPVCLYRGAFLPVGRGMLRRVYAKCPACGALERHRIQSVVARRVFSSLGDLGRKDLLHFAPEDCFRREFSPLFRRYVTADIEGGEVDLQEDITRLSLPSASFDVVYASHVLEHVRDDGAALSEICRVLRPGGLAILPVPIIGSVTVEYPSPNPHEFGHVRCPGEDYYRRYDPLFAKIDLYRSDDFEERFQLFIYEDRTPFPTKESPLRPSVPGKRHRDIVPVCWKA